jgi:hypothetical protein
MKSLDIEKADREWEKKLPWEWALSCWEMIYVSCVMEKH